MHGVHWLKARLKAEGELGRACIGGLLPAAGGSVSLDKVVTPDGVYAEVDARLQQAQRSITQSELADYHVDSLSEQIACLIGIDVPTMMRDRRDLVTKWHAQQKRLRASGGGGGGPRQVARR